MTSPAAPRWPGGLAVAAGLAGIAFASGVAIVASRTFALTQAVDDEVSYQRWFASVATDGWWAASRDGVPAGYVALVRAAGGDWSFLDGGRGLAIASMALIAAGSWTIAGRLGASRLARGLALVTFANLLMAGHAWVFRAIGDAPFTLVMLTAILGLARAVADRRPGLAVLAGATWAAAWTIRPLALLYSVALLASLTRAAWRDAEPRRAARVAALAVTACALGLALLQAPALVDRGSPVFEQKSAEGGNYSQQRYLSLLIYQATPTILPSLRVPLVEWDAVARYTDVHGAAALPSSPIAAWRRHPWRKLRAVPATLVLRAPFHVLGLVGVLAPLACGLAWLVPASPWRTRLQFALAVSLIYALLVSVVVSPFLEWRWLFGPCVVLLVAGAAALDGVRRSAPRLGLALAAIQLAFLALSFAFWIGRVIWPRGPG
jgi:hypothetical protein